MVAARVRAGLLNGTDLLVQDQIQAYEAVVAKLIPMEVADRRTRRAV